MYAETIYYYLNKKVSIIAIFDRAIIILIILIIDNNLH